MDTVKKKRGRKPKNFYNEVSKETEDQTVVLYEKKKRGRKKKYEIDNFEKILNRDHPNNFDHNIAYSDDEEYKDTIDDCVKKVSFGNLNITVSKKASICTDLYRNEIIEKTKTNIINENEWGSDEEKEDPVITINEELPEKKYSSFEKNENSSFKKSKVNYTIKNIINFDHWPDKTDICCWWCCHSFDTCPCTLPIKYDQVKKQFSFIGVFCSWNCVKSYNIEKADHRVHQRSELITFLVQRLFGIVEAISVKNAPPRQCLKMFGGYLDISEFRDSYLKTDNYRMNLLNYNYVYPEITETNFIKLKSEKKNLRLQRN